MQSRHRNRSGVVHLTKFFQEERRVEAGRGVSLVKEEQSHMWSEEGGVSSFCAPTGLVWAWLCSVSVSSHLQGHPPPPAKLGFICSAALILTVSGCLCCFPKRLHQFTFFWVLLSTQLPNKVFNHQNNGDYSNRKCL